MSSVPRTAFFADSYAEVDGVALTSRKLAAYAKSNGFPFLLVRAGKETRIETDGNFTEIVLKRSPLSIALDTELKYDPFFNRFSGKVKRALQDFQPDIIHITGLNDVSIIGAWLAHRLQVPMVGSWHTNIHEFAADRLDRKLRLLPVRVRKAIENFAKDKILKGNVLYYKMPKVTLAPNEEIISLLTKGTGRPSHLMARGVDSDLFSPDKRTVDDNVFRFGFVGRLRAEKNVRLLADIEKGLISKGLENFRFLIVGDGSEREWLERKMKTAEFAGYLAGNELAEAFANMDVFIFPSETETFGNVVQEANSSGVPAIVSDKGGPKFIVKDGETGFIAKDLSEFIDRAAELLSDRAKLHSMRAKARTFAASRSWSAVFENVYDAYNEAVEISEKERITELQKAK